MPMDDVTTLMVDQLKDIHSAERQILRALPKMLKKATSPALKQCFELHLEQTQVQVERVVQALEALGAKPGRKVCEAMRGLVEEGQSEMDENDRGPMLDVILIASAQRIEHYEIAAYGTMVTIAKSAGEMQVAELLAMTLNEEEETDKKLTQVAVSEVNMAFINSVRGSVAEAANDEPMPSKPARRKAS